MNNIKIGKPLPKDISVRIRAYVTENERVRIAAESGVSSSTANGVLRGINALTNKNINVVFLAIERAKENAVQTKENAEDALRFLNELNHEQVA